MIRLKISSVFLTRYFPGCYPSTHHNHYLPKGKPNCCWAGCKSSYWQMRLIHVANTQQAFELQNTGNKNFMSTYSLSTIKFPFLISCSTEERLRDEIWHSENLGSIPFWTSYFGKLFFFSLSYFTLCKIWIIYNILCCSVGAGVRFSWFKICYTMY